MKTRILFAIVFIGITTIFQGCYTILDIPEGNSDGYVTTYQYVPYFPDGTLIETPPPTYNPPSNGTDQPVVTTTQTKERTNGNVNGNGNIRNEGNGRGNTGRDSEFTRTSTSNSGSTQTSTTNTSSSNNTRSSSNTGNSGNGRR